MGLGYCPRDGGGELVDRYRVEALDEGVAGRKTRGPECAGVRNISLNYALPPF